MLAIILGTFLVFYGVGHIAQVHEIAPGTVYVSEPLDSRVDSRYTEFERPIVVKPLSVTAFNGIVHQAFDYSCGSASLTTLLNGYLDRDFDERQVMQGLLRFGESDRIIQRRGFSLLDMKRLVTALGYKSGGYRGTLKDLEMNTPALVPIHYSGFKHFVVVKKIQDQRVFVADPALGNISFPQARFQAIWDGNVMFLVYPNANEKTVNHLELHDADMRYVSDDLINWIAVQESMLDVIPTFSMEHRADWAVSLHLVQDVGIGSFFAPTGSTTGEPILVPTRMYFRAR